MSKSKSIHESALQSLKEQGIKKGSYVKVLFKVPSQAGGWRNAWVEKMDQYVGQTLEVGKSASDMCSPGIVLVNADRSHNCCYPAFALELVSGPKKKYCRLNKTWTAKVHEYDKTVAVGCQNISFAVIQKLVEAVKTPKSATSISKATGSGTNLTEFSKSLLLAQGMTVGSKVRVAMKLDTSMRYQFGFKDSVMSEMVANHENIFTVKDIHECSVQLDDAIGYNYPYFCLELVSNPNVDFKINKDHRVSINYDKRIVSSSQLGEVSFDTIIKLGALLSK